MEATGETPNPRSTAPAAWKPLPTAGHPREAAVVFQAAPVPVTTGEVQFSAPWNQGACRFAGAAKFGEPVWNPPSIWQGGVFTFGGSSANTSCAESSKTATASSLDNLEECPAAMLYNYQGYYQQLLHGVAHGNVPINNRAALEPLPENTTLCIPDPDIPSMCADSGNDGYVEGQDYTSDSDGESSEGSYHGNDGEDTECEDFFGLTDGTNTIPTEKELEQIDWETFYSTGDIVKIGESKCTGERNQTGSHHSGLSEAEGNGGTITGSEGSNMVGWKKRRRVKDGANRDKSRTPKGMGTAERAMRKYCELKANGLEPKYIFEPSVGLTFDSEQEAIDFYNLHSWEVGFGTKKGSWVLNNDGYQTLREVVCQRQGFDKRTKAKTKGCNCKAMIRLHRTEDDGWFISAYVKEHNHGFSATDAEKREWNSHGRIEQTVRDMVKHLRENNVTLSKLHCIMGSMYGSMENIPFTRRSLRTICAQIAREQRDDDIRKTLELFRTMREQDPGFQFSVQLDKKDQVKTLIWANGKSRSDYSCFGDVVTFDTTYTTNLYKMPFGLFVGVNNHFQSTIFGGVFMRDETSESFKWVFKEFLTLMGGVHPQTILTDQCRAMEIAILEIMPETTHLWCKWHVFKDARIELGPTYRENSAFRDDFHKVITEMLTVSEFKSAWKQLLTKYKLKGHHFMVKSYDKRKKWAKCYNKGKFCAGMTSTQRSESANNMLKNVVPRNSSMNRFVSNINKLLYARYAEEQTAEHDTKQNVRVDQRVWPVERHAMQVYTSKVYDIFGKEMNKTKSYVIHQGHNLDEFIVRHVRPDIVEKYRRSEFKVKCLNNGAKYNCDCGLSEHVGLLCCHILRVFIHLGVSTIPEAHIMQRWTRNARDLIPLNLRVHNYKPQSDYTKLLQQSRIHGKALEVARKGNHDYGTYEIGMKHLQIALKEIEEYIEDQKNGKLHGENSNGNTLSTWEGNSDNEAVSANRYGASGSCAGMSDDEVMRIKAPPKPITMGRPRTQRYLSLGDRIGKKGARPRVKKAGGKIVGTRITRHCTRCKGTDHDRRTCKKKEDKDSWKGKKKELSYVSDKELPNDDDTESDNGMYDASDSEAYSESE